MVCKSILPVGADILEPQYTFSPTNLQDPTTYFNRIQLRTVNILNNVLLKRYDLTNYRSLNNRIDIGDISDAEFADFLYNSGLSLQYVQELFINDFPVDIDYDLIEDIVKQVTDSSLTQPIVSQQDGIIGQGAPDQINNFLEIQDAYYQDSLLSNNQSICSSLSNAFSQVIDILVSARDLEQGVKDLASNSDQLIQDIKYNSLKSIISSLTSRIHQFQKELAEFVDSFGKQMLKNLDSINDTLGKQASNKAEMPSATYKFLKKRIDDTKSFYSDENRETIKQNLNKIFAGGLNQYDDKLPDVLNFMLMAICGLFTDVRSLMASPVQSVNQTIRSYETSYSDLAGYSTEKRNTIRSTGAQRIAPAQRQQQAQDGRNNYARSTSVSTPIPNSIGGSAGSTAVVSSTAPITTSPASTSTQNTTSTPASISTPNQASVGGSAGSSTGVSSSDQPTQRATPTTDFPSDATAEERALLETLSQDGIPGYFNFAPQVQNMGKKATNKYETNKTNKLYKSKYDPDENFHETRDGKTVDAGWAKVDPGVWLRLIRSIKSVKDQGLFSGELTINSAYRSTFYNDIIVGGASRSKHKAGVAIDVMFSNLSNEAGEELIKQASINGFGGISYYPSSDFSHFDLGGVRTWGANGKYSDVISDHIKRK